MDNVKECLVKFEQLLNENYSDEQRKQIGFEHALIEGLATLQ